MRGFAPRLRWALAIVVGLTAAAPAVATAGISPDPYSTTRGTGSFVVSTALGNGSCSLTSVAADLTGTTTGASGTITGFSAGGCAGYITSAAYDSAIAVDVDGDDDAATIELPIEMTNILGGRCIYDGRLTGSLTAPDTVTVSGTVGLVRQVSGICDAAHSLSLTVAFPGAEIASGGPGGGKLKPDPYETSEGTGIVGLRTLYGPASCLIRDAEIRATGTDHGARGTVDGFAVSDCSGIVVSGAFSSPISFEIERGAVTMAFSVGLESIFGGQCVYAGTLTGTIPDGGDVMSVTGTASLTRTVSGWCEASYSTSVELALPGARVDA